MNKHPSDTLPRLALILPPKDRPHWLPPPSRDFELSYLSWGFRWFGDSPIEPSIHFGYHYFVVLDGSPYLLIKDRLAQARAGTVFVIHPDCPMGHRDRPGKRCEILTWIWRTQPTHPALRPAAGDYLQLSLSRDALGRLKTLHKQCHKAVSVADDKSMLELLVARLQLDLLLLESREHRGAAQQEFRFNLAIEYLRNHLHLLEPVRPLCEYLQVSETALKQLFRKYAGKSPRAIACQWRMQWAREQLLMESGERSVKAVALSLGYKHPTDFSRAFKRIYGYNASDLLKNQLVAQPHAGLPGAGKHDAPSRAPR